MLESDARRLVGVPGGGRVPDTTYSLMRRYSEFRSLHNRLAGGGQLPPFPPKRSTRSQNERFVHVRRQELEAYLRHLASGHIRFRPELHSFLELSWYLQS